MIAVDTYSDFARLDALRGRWDLLWSLTPNPTFLQTFDGFRAAAEASHATPKVFAAMAFGRVVGLWPMLERTVRTPLGRRRDLSSVGGCAASSPIIGPSPCATAAIVARHLRDSGDWDSLSFAELVEPAGRAVSTRPAFAASGLQASMLPTSAFGEVELGGRWTDLLDGCDERTRLSIYRTQHYAAADGYRFERLRPVAGSVPPREIREAIAVSGRMTPGERDALLATMAEAARRGAADVALLRRHGNVVAASLSFVGSAGLENRFTTVAEDAPALAGVRLMLGLFRDGLARGDRRFTFSATPDHPAVGWTRHTLRRQAVRIEGPGRPAAGIRRVGRRLYAAWKISRAAGAA